MADESDKKMEDKSFKCVIMENEDKLLHERKALKEEIEYLKEALKERDRTIERYKLMLK